MDVLPLENGGLRLLEVPTGFYEQLSMLPKVCEPGDDETIQRRLFPSPIDAEEEGDLRTSAEEDWTDFVRPELEAAFDSDMLMVMTDLADAEVSEETDEEVYYQIEIAGAHSSSWFQVLNRARIVLSLRHRLPFSEYPLEEGETVALERLLASHLSDTYAGIMELLVRQMSEDLN